MPATVPKGMRLELSRSPVQEGKEAELGEWMGMLTDRYDECVATLPNERAVFEATFRNTEADGTTWILFMDEHGNPGVFWPHRDPDGAVHGDPLDLSAV